MTNSVLLLLTTAVVILAVASAAVASPVSREERNALEQPGRKEGRKGGREGGREGGSDERDDQSQTTVGHIHILTMGAVAVDVVPRGSLVMCRPAQEKANAKFCESCLLAPYERGGARRVHTK